MRSPSPSFPRRAFAAAPLAAILLACMSAAEDAAPKRVPSALRDLTPATHELVLHKWSGEINVPDPVACTVDPQGRVYVSATTRRKVGDIDIREHTMWIPDDVGFQSVEDKRAFIHRELAPGKMRGPRGGVADHNKDGSVDWKDLTVFSESIYQLRDTDGDGTADKMTTFATGFATEVTGIAAGVMWHDGWVYATIAPDLWRFKDTNDDGVADVREVVVHGFGVHTGYAGHDMHGLTVGPDGRIYWSIGDKGLHVTSREGRTFSHPNEGAVMRIEQDGSNFEIYAHGLRNPQEPAWDDFGDLFCVDNDADQPGERERFVYIPEASDTGWRTNFQYMKTDSPWMREGLWKPRFPGQAAYFLPTLASYSDGPAGFKYEPGTALGDQQRGMFLLSEFPSGKFKAFRAQRDGASFKMADARVLNDGVMGIGMSWHPDGSLMMVDWIGGYPLDQIGALWRVDAKTGTDNPARKETQRILTAGFASRADSELVAQLSHRDQRVRHGAQLELAKRGKKDELLAAAQGGGTASRAVGSDALPLLSRIHGIWGYGQLVRRNAAPSAPLVALLRDADAEIRRQAARVLGDATTTAARADGKALIPLLSDPEPRTRATAAIALGKYREASAVEPLFALAAKDGGEPVLRQAVVAGLNGCATAEQLVAKKADRSVNVRLVSVVALRRRAAPGVAEFLRDGDALVVEEAARAIHDDLSIPAALPALASVLEQNPKSEIVARRAINAALRVGTPQTAQRLLAYALNDAAPRAMREEALRTLRLWKTPPRLDLVDGRARDIKPAAIDGLLTPRLGELLALKDPALKTLGIEIMIAHALAAGAGEVAAIVTDDHASGELRAQALRLIAGDQRKHPAFARALDAALAAKSPAPLHREALALLLPNHGARLVQEAQTVLASRSIPEKQHALALLAQAAQPSADAVLATWGDALLSGRLDAALKLDVIEALRARGAANPALGEKLKAYGASAPGAAQSELLAGGDVARGREIVANHLNANCTACHTVESSAGSEVGPNLRAIGGQRDAAYLLESLLNPSAHIATGFGIVNVTLKNKTEITGTLAKETADAVTVRAFDGKMQTVRRADIASQTPPVSIMPPMGAILQPRELRDVVTYLSSLKGGRGGRTAKAEDGTERVP